MKMTSEHIYKLALVLAVMLGGSGITYLIGRMWSNVVARVFGVPPNARNRKVWATFCLGLPILVMAAIVRDNYGELRDWLSQSPVIASVGVLLVLLLVFAALVGAIIRLWRPAVSGSAVIRPKSGLAERSRECKR